MTEEERDNGLESLFRSELEDNELVAGSDLTGRIMRRLERREFFRFNLTRFNIWYVTAAAAGLIAGGMLLLSSPGSGAGSFAPRQDLPEKVAVLTDANAENKVTQTVETDSAAVTDNRALIAAEEAVTAPVETPLHREAIIAPRSMAVESIAVARSGEEMMSVAGPMVMAAIEPSVTSGCVPLNVRFRSNAGEGLTASWNFGDGGTSAVVNPDYIYDIPGTYRVTLEITDGRRRTSTAAVTIVVRDNPRAAFEIQQNESYGEGDMVLFMNLSEGAVHYLWDFGDGTFSTLDNPSYRYKREGRYDVKLLSYSADGCADSVTVNDIFTDRGLYLRFPNAFVPSRAGPTGGYYNQRTDEESQVFHPVASGVISYNLKIYSKAGMLVFECDDIAMGWDGYYKGELCSSGVYVWKVRATYRNGQSIIMAGDVTLINY